MTKKPLDEIQTLFAECHEIALSKGWWDGKPKELSADDFAEQCMLIASEAFEAFECYRSGQMGVDYEQAIDATSGAHTSKPVGFPTEIADVVIRIADQLGWMGWDVKFFHPITPIKKTTLVLERCVQLCLEASYQYKRGCTKAAPPKLASVVCYCLVIADRYNFDLWEVMARKCAYNRTRSYRHGGKIL